METVVRQLKNEGTWIVARCSDGVKLAGPCESEEDALMAQVRLGREPEPVPKPQAEPASEKKPESGRKTLKLNKAD